MSDENQNSASGMDNPATESIQDWRSALPEEIRGAESLQKYKGVDELASAYLAAEKLVSGKQLPFPETEEEFNKVYSALGRPETADGYQFGLPDGVTADWIKDNISEEWEQGFKAEAHKLGLSAKQAGSLRDNIIKQNFEAIKENQEANEAFLKEAGDKLKQEWGEAFNTRANAARQLLEFSDTNGEFGKLLQATGLDKHPVVLKYLGNLGVQVIEDENLPDDKSGGAQTPQQVEENIKSLQASPAYRESSHPEHKFVVDKVQKLYEKLCG